MWSRWVGGMSDDGAVMAEYALLMTLIAIALISVVAIFGDTMETLFRAIVDILPF
jgi:Flp pilus assembly pilin Flp